MILPVGTPRAPTMLPRGGGGVVVDVGAAGEGEVDGECGEVGEELGGGVVLMAVPGAVPEDSGLGVPLASHDEVALVAVAGDRERELVVKGDVEGDGVVGSEWVGESDFGYGVVLRVAVVGSDEVHD